MNLTVDKKLEQTTYINDSSIERKCYQGLRRFKRENEEESSHYKTTHGFRGENLSYFFNYL